MEKYVQGWIYFLVLMVVTLSMAQFVESGFGLSSKRPIGKESDCKEKINVAASLSDLGDALIEIFGFLKKGLLNKKEASRCLDTNESSVEDEISTFKNLISKAQYGATCRSDTIDTLVAFHPKLAYSSKHKKRLTPWWNMFAHHMLRTCQESLEKKIYIVEQLDAYLAKTLKDLANLGQNFNWRDPNQLINGGNLNFIQDISSKSLDDAAELLETPEASGKMEQLLVTRFEETKSDKQAIRDGILDAIISDQQYEQMKELLRGCQYVRKYEHELIHPITSLMEIGFKLNSQIPIGKHIHLWLVGSSLCKLINNYVIVLRTSSAKGSGYKIRMKAGFRLEKTDTSDGIYYLANDSFTVPSITTKASSGMFNRDWDKIPNFILNIKSFDWPSESEVTARIRENSERMKNVVLSQRFLKVILSYITK